MMLTTTSTSNAFSFLNSESNTSNAHSDTLTDSSGDTRMVVATTNTMNTMVGSIGVHGRRTYSSDPLEDDVIDQINRKFSHIRIDQEAYFCHPQETKHFDTSSTSTFSNAHGTLQTNTSNHGVNGPSSNPDGFLDIKQLLPNYRDALLSALDSNSLDQQLNAVIQLRRFLSLDKISSAIDSVLEIKRTQTLIELTKINDSRLQYEICWILTNICAGNHAQTESVVRHGALPMLLTLLLHADHVDVQIQACWCLGNICGDSPKLRMLALQQGIVHVLLKTFSHYFLHCGLSQLHHPTQLNFARIFCWVMANLCRGQKDLPEWKLLAPLFAIMKAFLSSNDFEIVVDTCWGLSRILQGLYGLHNEPIIPSIAPPPFPSSSPSSGSSLFMMDKNVQGQNDMEINLGLCEALIDILNLKRFPDVSQDDALRIQTPALRAVTNLASGEDPVIDLLVQAGILPVLSRFARSPCRSLAREALLALANIAAGHLPLLHALLMHDVPPLWLHWVQREAEVTDVVCVREAWWGLSNFTCTRDPGMVAHLLQVLRGDFKPVLFRAVCAADVLTAEKAADTLFHIATASAAAPWLSAADCVAIEREILPFWINAQHPRILTQFKQLLHRSRVQLQGSVGGSGCGGGADAYEDAILCDVQNMILE